MLDILAAFARVTENPSIRIIAILIICALSQDRQKSPEPRLTLKAFVPTPEPGRLNGG
ncbi:MULTISPECIES: hypothetical protein [unclassified Sphingobium]|uniref:hypothetical protein n=1 Tax=unclassified Sphingobium TaxID=2611147 RepID=UPI00160A7A71|nr:MULTISPECIES: hypothetical protein [unclassified Sphingobium]MCW2416679.1 hypothetical protein [Sphingobium sp. B8D3A]